MQDSTYDCTSAGPSSQGTVDSELSTPPVLQESQRGLMSPPTPAPSPTPGRREVWGQGECGVSEVNEAKRRNRWREGSVSPGEARIQTAREATLLSFQPGEDSFCPSAARFPPRGEMIESFQLSKHHHERDGRRSRSSGARKHGAS